MSDPELRDRSIAYLMSTIRERIELAEKELLRFPQLVVPIRQFFMAGAYAREMTLPANTYWTGKIHKYEQINLLTKGEMLVLIDNQVVHVQAPFTYVAPAGTKRIGYTLTECVWTTLHATWGMNLSGCSAEEIDNAFVAESEADYQVFLEQKRELALEQQGVTT